jgi:glycosyltransferase involved in cell wall biosynthesis
MRIVQVSPSISASFGGPAEVVAQSSLKLQDLGYEVCTLVFGQSETGLTNRKHSGAALPKNAKYFFTIRDRPIGGLLSIKSVKTLSQNIRDADIVLLHGIYSYQNCIAYLLSKVWKKPTVAMPHGSLTKYQSSKKRIKKFFAHKIFFDRLIHGLDLIITATNIEKEEILANYTVKVRVVGLGIVVKSPEEDDPSSHAKLYDFLFLGRITEKKRVDLTIKAFKKHLELSPNSKLAIAGTGETEYLKQIYELVNRLGLTNSVDFLGLVTGEQKTKLFYESRFFILNSEDENFAIAVAEALSHGLPTVVSSHVALSELVKSYSAGVIIEDVSVDSLHSAMYLIQSLDYELLSARAIQASNSLNWLNVIVNWDLALRSVTKKEDDRLN